MNEEPSDKRAEKLDLLQDCLPDDWERLVNRPPLENYMDPELCGKWVVRSFIVSSPTLTDDNIRFFKNSFLSGMPTAIKFLSFPILSGSLGSSNVSSQTPPIMLNTSMAKCPSKTV